LLIFHAAFDIVNIFLDYGGDKMFRQEGHVGDHRGYDGAGDDPGEKEGEHQRSFFSFRNEGMTG